MPEEKEFQNGENPAHAPASTLRLDDELVKQAYEQIAHKAYVQAARAFDDIIKRFGDLLEEKQKVIIFTELATLYLWLGDYESARRYGEKAAQTGPAHDEAYIILGKIAVAEYRFEEARSFFLKTDQENSGRWLGLALVAIKLRKTGEASTYCAQAIRHTSALDSEYILLRAYVDLLEGQTATAVRVTRDALKTLDNPFLLLIAAEIFMTAGAYGEAHAVITNVQAVCPDNDQAYALLAHIEYAQEAYGAAEEAALRATERNPRNAYAQTMLMKCALRRGQYDNAESIGREILRNCPQYALAHANLGDVYFLEERYELAEIEYDQTQELMDSKTKGARLRQARMAFIKGNVREAAGLLEDLIAGHHTYYDDAMCDLVLCYDKLHNEAKRAHILDKMHFRRSFYHRTEELLRQFNEKV